MPASQVSHGSGSMIVVTLVGLKKSGKTACCEALIREFKRRGLKVGGVKSMHHAKMTIDTKGKDTWRQKQAGADFVVSLSNGELGYIERAKGRATLWDALAHIPADTDVLVCEGVETDDPKAIKVVVAKAPEMLEETFDIRGLGSGKDVVALTGIIANEVGKHPKYPVFNCKKPKQVKALADLIIKKGKRGR